MEEHDPATPDESSAFGQAEVRAHVPSRWFWSILWTVALAVILAVALWPTSSDDAATQIATWGLWLCVLVAAWRLVVALIRAVQKGPRKDTRAG